MTEPSQYFKGRTVQEQMNEVIGYVDARAEEVAAAKADDVLEPAEQAKDDAIAAKEAAEQARDTTLAALPQIQQDITDLKAEDVALDGGLDNVELRITTAEGNIVTIQGRVTAVENKNTQQDNAIAALQTADEQNVKLTGTNAIGNYAVLLTGNQTKRGQLTFAEYVVHPMQKEDFAISQNTGTPWVKLFEFPTSRRQIRGKFVSTDAHAFFLIDNMDNTNPIVRIGGWGFIGNEWIAVTYNDGDDKLGVWFKSPNFSSEKIFIEEIGNYGGASTYDYLTIVQNPTYVALPSGDHIVYSTIWSPIQ